MKVVHFCRTFSKLSETFIYDVIRELDSRDITNKVVTFRRENSPDRPFDAVSILQPSLLQRSAKTLKKIGGSLGLRKYNAVKELDALRSHLLLQYLKSEKPDVLHAHFGLQGLMAWPETRKLNIPLVVSFHGYDAFRLPQNSIWLVKLQRLFQEAAAITVVSNFMKEHLITLGCPPEKLHLIHVGKRISDYNYSGTLNWPVRKFISIGRLCEKKGFLDGISAFALLKENYPDLKLQIVGIGELEGELKALINQENLSNQITMSGSLKHPEVIKALQGADAFILCSKTGADGDQEGIPTVLMEAQAMGLPCVTTRHSGIPEVIPQESQFLLAQEGNVQDIAAKIEALINAPENQLLQVKQAGRTIVESEFNLEIENNKLIALYKSLQ